MSLADDAIAYFSPARQRELLRAWASSRGMRFVEPRPSRAAATLEMLDRVGFRLLPVPARHDVTLGVPVAERGSARRVVHVVDGGGDGQPRRVVWLSYRDPGDGGDMETWNYTVVEHELPAEVAARFAGVALYPRRHASTQRWYGLRDDERDVRLESVEFERALRLRAVPGQDPIALRELFAPNRMLAMVAALETAHHDVEPMWEQRGTCLAFLVAGHAIEPEPLDAALAAAAEVRDMFLEEAR